MSRTGSGLGAASAGRAAAGAFLLFRVDDRLLHGQVTLGWGGPLRARGFLLADDALASDPGTAALYEAAAPEGSEVRVVPLARVSAWTAGSSSGPAETILVVRGVAQAAELLACGIPGPVNLGGLHLRPGAREVLPYLFLRPEEERLLAGLLASGHEIYAQDLPGNPRRDLKTLLSLEAPPPEPAP